MIFLLKQIDQIEQIQANLKIKLVRHLEDEFSLKKTNKYQTASFSKEDKKMHKTNEQ